MKPPSSLALATPRGGRPPPDRRSWIRNTHSARWLTDMPNVDRGKLLFVVLCFGALALYPLVSGNFGIDLVTKIMILAIFALSLELLVGGTGLICFGQAAFFGIGAYTAVKLSPESDAASLLWLMPASVLLAALYALAVGALS